jgi:biotin carboxyl carrier protein
MTFEVDINGRSRAVSVERIGRTRHFRISIDGRAQLVDVVQTGEFGLSLLLDGQAATSREVSVTRAGVPGELLITIEGRTVAASVNARRTRRAATDAGEHAQGEQSVVAPMPGRVVRVLVAAGDEVAARQGVIVVEAMKMENELRSPKAGRIKDVAVSAGMSVEAGRVLVVVE